MSGDFFNASEVAELEAVGTSAMAGTLVIKRPTRTGDGMGGFSESYLAVGTVPCHIWRDRYGSEKEAGAQITALANWYVAVPNGTDIREIDYGECNSVTYQIVSVPSGTTWNAHLRCEAITMNRELRT